APDLRLHGVHPDGARHRLAQRRGGGRDRALRADRSAARFITPFPRVRSLTAFLAESKNARLRSFTDGGVLPATAGSRRTARDAAKEVARESSGTLARAGGGVWRADGGQGEGSCLVISRSPVRMRPLAPTAG